MQDYVREAVRKDVGIAAGLLRFVQVTYLSYYYATHSCIHCRYLVGAGNGGARKKL